MKSKPGMLHDRTDLILSQFVSLFSDAVLRDDADVNSITSSDLALGRRCTRIFHDLQRLIQTQLEFFWRKTLHVLLADLIVQE